MRRKRKPKGYWTKDQCKLEALKYDNKGDFCSGSSGAHDAARSNGWLRECCAHMALIIKPKGFWTKRRCKLEAIKYTSRTEFYYGNPGVHSIAFTKGWLDYCCSHMVEIKKTKGYWTKNRCRKEALKYNTRTEFQKGNGSAHNVARVEKWLDEICSHMPICSTSSKPELELFDIIKEKYPSAKKIRDCKVKIKDKPHAQRFDIDIFIPELNLGIEYDGTWHHSFEGLKRGRKHWPDDDIYNYHQIKDNWFLSSKGIKLLHVDESDWINNKEHCIKRCFEFLGQF